jgi:hypothetical protein
MSSEALLEVQIEPYRNMTGEQRLKIALDMHMEWCNESCDAIRRQHPHADEQMVLQLLREQIDFEREPK